MESNREDLKAKLKEFRDNPEQARKKLDEFYNKDENYQHQKSLFRLSRALQKHITKTLFPVRDVLVIGMKEWGHTVIIFYHANEDIKNNESNGISESIEQVIREEVGQLVKEPPEELELIFKFDSHENVLEKANGNYQIYLR